MSFTDRKTMQPKEPTEVKEFTMWKRDIEDYTESVRNGMKKVLA